MTLFEDPFSLLSTLCPLLRRSITCVNAREFLELAARKSSAREMVLALGERFVVLCPIDYQDESDSDQEGVDEEAEVVEDDWEAEGAVREFVVLLHLFSIGSLSLSSRFLSDLLLHSVLPRISTAKPLKFLVPVLESFLSAVENLAEHGAFSASTSEPGIDSLSLDDRFDCAVEATNALIEFIDVIVEEGIWISSEKERVRLYLPSLR